MEYQARGLLAVHGVPVPDGAVAASPDEAHCAAALMRGPVMVKAQVAMGGRGKAGAVRLAATPAEAARAAEAILGLTIKGHRVSRVLVVPASEIAAEYYLSFALDRGGRSVLAIACAEGGMEIEELAARRPAAVVRRRVDPARGFGEPEARELAVAAGFPADIVNDVVGVLLGLWETFTEEDALLVEVNPLALDTGGRLIALDGKITLDDNARFRHPGHAVLAGDGTSGPLEAAARAKGLQYVKLDGEIGVIGNGAGLVLSTLDVVARAGQRYDGVGPANFLDLGGGASATVMADGLALVLADPAVKSVLVNVFGGITACDVVADGIIAAFDALRAAGEPLGRPIVVRLEGNNAAGGRRALAAAHLPGVRLAATMDSAADTAAELAALVAAELAGA